MTRCFYAPTISSSFFVVLVYFTRIETSCRNFAAKQHQTCHKVSSLLCLEFALFCSIEWNCCAIYWILNCIWHHWMARSGSIWTAANDFYVIKMWKRKIPSSKSDWWNQIHLSGDEYAANALEIVQNLFERFVCFFSLENTFAIIATENSHRK